jgi:hypothetical protein
MVKEQDSIFSILKSEIESELLLYEDFWDETTAKKK